MTKSTWCPNCKAYSVGLFSGVCRLCQRAVGKHPKVSR